jgi:hypothetical protein
MSSPGVCRSVALHQDICIATVYTYCVSVVIDTGKLSLSMSIGIMNNVIIAREKYCVVSSFVIIQI